MVQKLHWRPDISAGTGVEEKMKSKILGVLAVGLLSGPMSAQAAFIYSLEGTFFSGLSVDFTLTFDELITSSTTFPISDFDSFNGLPLAVSISFLGPLTSQPEILFNTLVGTDGFFWAAPWPGPGTYCAGLGGCDGRTA